MEFRQDGVFPSFSSTWVSPISSKTMSSAETTPLVALRC
jgi:hypothetical protein